MKAVESKVELETTRSHFQEETTNTRAYKPFLYSAPTFLIVVTATAHAQSMSATADIVSAADPDVSLGTATLSEGEKGVTVSFDVGTNDVITGGEHAVHIHETGSCEKADSDDDGSEEPAGAAGGHYNPTNVGHGEDNGPHVGDSAQYNYAFEDDGSFTGEVVFPLASLEGENPFLDDDGSAIVIHDGTDDMQTDPDGAAGTPVACGVIMAQAASGDDSSAEAATEASQEAPQVPTSESNTFSPARRDFSEELMNGLELMYRSSFSK